MPKDVRAARLNESLRGFRDKRIESHQICLFLVDWLRVLEQDDVDVMEKNVTDQMY